MYLVYFVFYYVIILMVIVMSKKIYFIWFFLIILILGTLLYIGKIHGRNEKKYLTLEMELEEAASIYFSQSNLSLSNGESLSVDINDLYNNGYIDTISVNQDTCDGTVLIEKNDNEYSYDASIVCDNYKTE